MSISVNVSSPAVQAVVNAAGVSASVQAAQAIAAGVTGGFGPAGVQGQQGIQGPAGPVGPTGQTGPAGTTTIAGATDVQITNLADGDLLRYSSAVSRFVNISDKELLDAGSF